MLNPVKTQNLGERKKGLCFRTGFIVAFLSAAIYAGLASFCIGHGRPNADEGFYALASKLAWEGKVVYRDYGYTQTPLLPYIQGAAMKAVGFGVREQRWLNLCWTTGTVFIVVSLLYSFGLPAWLAFAGALLWTGSVPVVYYCTIGKTYALAQLFLTACALGLYFSWHPHKKLVWIAITGVLAVGCRLTVGPAVMVIWLGLITLERPSVSWMRALVIPGLVAFAVLLPFVLVSPENALFWTGGYHAKSQITKRFVVAGWDTLWFCPGVVGFAVYSLVKYSKSIWGSPSAWNLAAAFSGIVLNVILNGIYADYTTPFWPLAVIGAGGLLSLRGTQLSVPNTRLVVLICLGCTLAASIYKWPQYEEPGYLDSVDKATAFLKSHTSKRSIVLPSMPEIPLQAGRSITKGLELGKFGVTGEMAPEMAKKLNLMDYNTLVMTIAEQKPGAIVLSPYCSWSFGWSVPSLHLMGARGYIIFLTVLNAAYVDSYRDDFFVIYLPRSTIKVPSSLTKRQSP